MAEPVVPEIHDKTPKLVGLAQEYKHWAMAAVALLVVLVIMFSNAGTPRPVRTASSNNGAPDPKPMSPAQVKAFQDELQKATNELAQGNAREEAIKQRAALVAGGQAPGIATQGPVMTQYAPQTAAVSTAAEPKHDSNIVESFRSGSAKLPAPSSPLAAEQADLRNLIDAERKALEANLAASSRPSSPVPQKPAQAEPDAKDLGELNQSAGKLYRLFEGSLIETVLTNRLNGSFTGPVSVLVTSPVYSHDREHVLIPQGSRIVGEAQRVGTQGQQRLSVVFHRVLMPDGFSVSLDKFTGLNQIGETGLKDQVNHHYPDVFGTSVALGLISGLSGFGTGSVISTGGAGQYRQAVASSIGQSSTQVLDSRLNQLPTITIREGHRVRILLRQDLEIPAYENHRIPSDI